MSSPDVIVGEFLGQPYAIPRPTRGQDEREKDYLWRIQRAIDDEHKRIAQGVGTQGRQFPPSRHGSRGLTQNEGLLSKSLGRPVRLKNY